LIKQIIQDHELGIKYGAIDKLDNTITLLNKQIEQRNNHLSEIKGREDNLYSSIKDLNKEINSLKDEIASLEKDTICTHYSFSDYDALSSEECKNKLALLRQEEQEAIKSDSVLKVEISSNKKKVIAVSKQILRCFDSECENILLNLSVKNIDSSRNKITRSFETLNKLYVTDGISMKNNLLEYKLKELNLVYTYELKKEQERELQKAIKEQMIEEEKVRKEIEQKKAKLEKDQNQCNNEIHKLMGYMQKSQDDVEKQLYIDKIKELEDKINQLEGEKSAVLEREANARAGYVYVISNIGSFGDDVYKIGMTRRLEPMDRIKELSSASVPFEFDVHAMIFSDDAPALETALHQTFNGKRVNMVNTHKEFFRVSLDEIEATVKANYNETVTFTRIPVAKEYNETLEILGQGRHSLVS
jgi:chromosome segregation ATPase